MAYDKQTWVDGPEGGTPLSAERLNHMENGIEEAQNVIPPAPTIASIQGLQTALDAKALNADHEALESTVNDLVARIEALESA